RLDRLRGACRLDSEVRSELRPQPSPAKDLSVYDVERLIASLFRRRCPLQMMCEEARVRHICERIPLQMRAGEDEGLAGLATDGRIDSQRDAHVHRIAQGVAHDGMRTVNAPTETSAFGRSEEYVFLGVVEVFAGESWRVLTKWRLGGGLAVGLEGP